MGVLLAGIEDFVYMTTVLADRKRDTDIARKADSEL